MRNNLTAERLREVLDYNPETGIFTFKISRGCRRAGDIADCRHTGSDNTYLTIAVDSTRFLAHRLAWLYQTGEWPKCLIDHQDLNRSNNKWSNLREASYVENRVNSRSRSDSTLGVKGVTRHYNKFRACIQINGKQKYLGLFATIELAQQAYIAASCELHGEFGRAA